MQEDLFFLGVKGIIKNEKNEILLLKANGKKFKDNVMYRDIPGGRVDYGESVENALKREIKEETGIDNIIIGHAFGMILSSIRIFMDQKDYGLILSAYEVHPSEQQTIILSDEHIDYDRFDKHEALKLLEIKYPKDFLKEIGKKL